MKNDHLGDFKNELSLNKIRQIWSGRINLLCIEDNKDICQLFCEEFFRSPVFSVKSVQNIEGAKQAIFSKTLYHCWILDLTLDRHNDGLELLKLRPNFPFCIVVSGARSMDDANVAKDAGAFSVHDKGHIFRFASNILIYEVCGLSVLSFLLKGKNPTNFEMYRMLIREFVKTPEEWVSKFPITDLTLRRICLENSFITPKQFLNLFHALNFALLSECLSNTTDDFQEISERVTRSHDFYIKCSEYVLSRLDSVYAPLYQ
jgi:hypothetical protein